MPLPTPRKGETNKKFISRCVKTLTDRGEDESQKVRLGMCYTQLRKARGKKAEAQARTELEGEAFVAGNQKLGLRSPAKRGEVGSEMRQVPLAAFSLSVPSEAYEFVTADDGTRRARMHALTGKPLQHWYWDTIIFDLDGLKAQKKKLAGLADHHPGLRICVWDSFDVKDDGLFVEGYFLDNPNAKQILGDIDKGFPFEGSIHFNRRESKIEQLAPDAETVVNGHRITGPAFIVRKAAVDEVSWCVHGVDYNTAGTALGTARGDAARDETVEIEITTISGGAEMPGKDDLTEDEVREVASAYLDGLTADQVLEVKGVAGLREAAIEAAVKGERERVQTCAAMFKDDPAFALATYLGGKDLKDARVELAESKAAALADENKRLMAAIPGEGQKPVGQEFSDGEKAEADRKKKAEEAAGGDDPVAKFDARFAELKDKGLSAEDALGRIVDEDPELHEAYLEAVNK